MKNKISSVLIMIFLFTIANQHKCNAQSLLKNRLHFTNYFQTRCTSVFNDNGPDKNISLRRYKLLAKGKINSRLSFYSGIIYKTGNSSSTDNRIFPLDAYIDYSFSKILKLRIGQFKPPFGWERFQSDYKMPGTERSQVVNRLIPNGSLEKSFVRDYGLQFWGNMSKNIKYETALMSGNGANTKINNTNFPMLNGRLIYITKTSKSNPFLLTSQIACSWRQNSNINFINQLPGTDKNIFSKYNGTDFREDIAFSIKKNNTNFSAEYIKAWFSPELSEKSNLIADGWFFQLTHALIDRVVFLLKYEKFDPDKSVKNSFDQTWLTFGANYLLNKKHGRIMLNYINKNEDSEPVSNDAIILQLQYFIIGG